MAKTSVKRQVAAENGLLKRAVEDPEFISLLIATLDGKGTVRFEAAKKLQIIAKADPSLVYPYFSVFSKLLDSPSSVLLWNAVIILSYLVAVDAEKRFDDVLDKYYAHLKDGNLVTAANILASSGRIARSRPDLSDRITGELLTVDNISLPTAECHEVARGHALSSFAEYVTDLRHNQPVYDFVLRCSKSHRPAVRIKAEDLLRR